MLGSCIEKATTPHKQLPLISTELVMFSPYDYPSQPDPECQQNKAAEYKHQESVHNPVVGRVNETVQVSGGHVEPCQGHQDAILYHQHQSQKNRCVEQNR